MTGNIVIYYEEANGVDMVRGFVIKSIDEMWHVSDFKTERQLQEFAALLGFTYEWDEVSSGRKIGHCSHVIDHDAKDEEVVDEISRMNSRMFRMACSGIKSDEYSATMEWLDRRYDTERGAYGINDYNLVRSKKIKALSNGSIVDCLVVNDGETIRIYRCNPNAKKFYDPMSLDEHIKHERIHGVY